MNSTSKLKEAINLKEKETNAVANANMGSSLLNTLVGEKFKSQLALALPRAITPDRFCRVVVTECRKTPALLNTTQESFLGAIMQAGQLGLEPASALGHCYLIPYKNTCQLIVGYKGMIELARRSGQIKSISAQCVYEKDEFSYELGLHPDIKHKPSYEGDRGAIKFVYAVAELVDGGVQFEVMTRAEIEDIRNKSQGWVAYKKGYAKSCIWVDHFSEMARKSVVRRLFKMLPVSIEVQRAIYADEKADRGEAITPSEVADNIFVDSGNTIDMPIAEPDSTDDGEPNVVDMALKEQAEYEAQEA